MQLFVADIADMVEKASAIQKQECKAAGVTRAKMEEVGDFSKKANISH